MTDSADTAAFVLASLKVGDRFIARAAGNRFRLVYEVTRSQAHAPRLFASRVKRSRTMGEYLGPDIAITPHAFYDVQLIDGSLDV